jgi:hypothetical protein
MKDIMIALIANVQLPLSLEREVLYHFVSSSYPVVIILYRLYVRSHNRDLNSL